MDAERRHVDRDPFMRLIAAYLRSNRPPPVPLGLVHGDFQVANVLLGADGDDVLIDWELTHIGDPREDLGWCMMASVTQPPDVVGADEEAFYTRYREISGLSEEQVNPTTTDYFLLLASATVFVSVLEQLAAFDRGETTGIQLAYMSPAVAGMHDVFYRALKRHAASVGRCGVISRPTTQQLIDAICVELASKVAPAVTDPVVQIQLEMALAVLQTAASAQRQRAGVDAGGARRHRADRPPDARRPPRRHGAPATPCRPTPTA